MVYAFSLSKVHFLCFHMCVYACMLMSQYRWTKMKEKAGGIIEGSFFCLWLRLKKDYFIMNQKLVIRFSLIPIPFSHWFGQWKTTREHKKREREKGGCIEAHERDNSVHRCLNDSLAHVIYQPFMPFNVTLIYLHCFYAH